MRKLPSIIILVLIALMAAMSFMGCSAIRMAEKETYSALGHDSATVFRIVRKIKPIDTTRIDSSIHFKDVVDTLYRDSTIYVECPDSSIVPVHIKTKEIVITKTVQRTFKYYISDRSFDTVIKQQVITITKTTKNRDNWRWVAIVAGILFLVSALANAIQFKVNKIR